MTRQLLSPRASRAELAGFFDGVAGPVSLYVREDRCFRAETRLEIGRLSLHPSATEDGRASLQAAVANGFYDIRLDNADTLAARVVDTIDYGEFVLQAPNRVARQKKQARRSLDLLPAIFTRVGLLQPRLDADAMSRLPLRSPATIIADTSAIINGGLDFVARFLYPLARVKVPGIAHMEIVNEIDTYFGYRRDDNLRAGDALLSHVKGVGGQRVLLRLQLQEELEIERSSIFQEPMRTVFTKDGGEDGSMATTGVVRSHADRLILEAARQHQAQVHPGHDIYLMTSDQGLARMALAEGMKPMFFEIMDARSTFPAVLSGVSHDPFKGSLFGVPLQSLLWELAVCFGSAGLQADDGRFVDVAAIGEGLPWAPFHSAEDLLWFETGSGNPGRLKAPAPDPAVAAAEALQVHQSKGAKREARATTVPSVRRATTAASTEMPRESAKSSPQFKFSAGELLRLLGLLMEREEVDAIRVAQAVGVSDTQLRSYLGFLRAGGFVTLDEAVVKRTEHLVDLYQAMRSRDFRRTGELLRRVPSFDDFLRDLDERRVVDNDQLKGSSFWKLPNYRRYAEAVGRSLLIPGEGLYATPNDPTAEAFVDAAVAAYDRLAAGAGDYVLTGAWLEELAKSAGIHPLVARERLSQASAAGMLDRFTRGATPDTRFENHGFHVIEPSGSAVQLLPVSLYHGDFLLSERTSVEIRIERPTVEPA